MTELYRGLLFVQINKFYEMILSLRTHIQSFKLITKDPENYFDVGVLGFWNLMLEITFTFFILSCLMTGVVLTSVLAIVFYPCYGFITYSALVLKNIRNPPNDEILKDKSKSLDESPVIIKKDGKEKE